MVTIIRRLFLKKMKNDCFQEDPDMKFKGRLISEKELGYTYVQPEGKKTEYLKIMFIAFTWNEQLSLVCCECYM